MAQLTDFISGDINALLVNGGIGLVEPPVRIGGVIFTVCTPRKVMPDRSAVTRTLERSSCTICRRVPREVISTVVLVPLSSSSTSHQSVIAKAASPYTRWNNPIPPETRFGRWTIHIIPDTGRHIIESTK